MDNDFTCFGKLVDIINGNDIYLRTIPCIAGRYSLSEKSYIKDKKCLIGRTIEIDYENYKIPEIYELRIKSKIILDKCKRISPAHFIIFYDFKNKEFKIKALNDLYFNESIFERNKESKINSMDRISFDCELCLSSHAYMIVFPKMKDETAHEEIIQQYDFKNVNKRLPDVNLANKWTNHEKDCLRKYILIYGYGRWQIIKQNSGGVLSDKSEIELKIFSNAFLKTIIEFLPQEKAELRKFLINLIDERQDEPFILPKKDDWGTLVKQRAPAWGKRIQLIFRVCLIVEKFKSERRKNKELRKNADNISINNLDEADKLRCEINKTYDYWDNLLNFLPNHAFYGQRPSIWWTKTHDIDLLRGTYKYGYANYQLMRSDPKLSFSKLEKDSSFQEFPNADTITRRLKKLIQIIIKNENNGVISFEDRKNVKEPTGFNLEEKNKITSFLLDYGVPLNYEGKSDWPGLKDQLVKIVGIDNSKTPQVIERLVQTLRMIAQLVIQLNDNNDASVDENMLEQMDPDNDGFNISFDDAEKMNKNMNILHFLRKHILVSNAKLFNNGLNTLIDMTNKNIDGNSNNLPTNWDCTIHDIALLRAVDENGFLFLSNLSNNKDYNFENIYISNDDAMNRINFLCEFFRDFSSGNKSKKKKEVINVSDSINKRKTNKLIINRDKDGNILYPISINSSLQIFNLGRIEYERSNYHTEKNLFPIGFKSVREHSSMLHLGERALYTCEILDGGSKPLYQLTPHEDPDNPILKESSTGCWIVICNKINALQNNKRNKVTISGTERFGLCEPNVVKLLQGLPSAERCSKYSIKNLEEI